MTTSLKTLPEMTRTQCTRVLSNSFWWTKERLPQKTTKSGSTSRRNTTLISSAWLTKNKSTKIQKNLTTCSCSLNEKSLHSAKNFAPKAELILKSNCRSCKRKTFLNSSTKAKEKSPNWTQRVVCSICINLTSRFGSKNKFCARSCTVRTVTTWTSSTFSLKFSALKLGKNTSSLCLCLTCSLATTKRCSKEE